MGSSSRIVAYLVGFRDHEKLEFQLNQPIEIVRDGQFHLVAARALCLGDTLLATGRKLVQLQLFEGDND